MLTVELKFGSEGWEAREQEMLEKAEANSPGSLQGW